jgi:nitrous oxidase accessory protein NosD
MRVLASAAALVVALALGSLGATMPGTAHATPSKDGCTGILQVDPQAQVGVVVATPGVWCLDSDLASARDVPGGAYVMIQIAAADVTIDCRGHRLEYSGHSEFANGVVSTDGGAHRIVRNCRIRGFSGGIHVSGTDYYLIEDNVIEASRPMGWGSGTAISAGGQGTIRRNRIVDSISRALAVSGSALIVDNLIDGVTDEPNFSAIQAVDLQASSQVEFRGNTIRRLKSVYQSYNRAYGVQISQPLTEGPRHVDIRDNVFVMDGESPSTAILCIDGIGRYADNIFVGWQFHSSGCEDAGGNDVSDTVVLEP